MAGELQRGTKKTTANTRAVTKKTAPKRTAAKKTAAKKTAAKKAAAPSPRVPAAPEPDGFVPAEPSLPVPVPPAPTPADPVATAPARPRLRDEAAALSREILGRGVPADVRRAAWSRAAAAGAFGLGASMLASIAAVWSIKALAQPEETEGQSVPVGRAGAMLFWAAHAVRITSRTAQADFGPAQFQPLSYSARFAPLGMLGIILLAYAAAGFFAARWTGGTPRERVVAAIRVALPIAAGSLVLSWFVGGRWPAGDEVWVRVEADWLGAFVAPLLAAALAAPLGALANARGARAVRPVVLAAIERRFAGWGGPVRAALQGFGVAGALVLFAGTVATVVQAIQHPTGTGEALGNARTLAAIVLAVVLLLPNAVAAGIIGSMGIAATIRGSSFGFGELGIFGGAFHGSGTPGSEVDVPWYALFGLGIAAIATVRMGLVAARFAPFGRDPTTFALRSAVPFTILTWVAGALITVSSSFPVFWPMYGTAVDVEVPNPAPGFTFEPPRPFEPPPVEIPTFEPFDPPPGEFPTFEPFVPPSFGQPGFHPGPTWTQPGVEASPAGYRAATPGDIPMAQAPLLDMAEHRWTAGPSPRALVVVPIVWALAGAWLGAKLAVSRGLAVGAVPADDATAPSKSEAPPPTSPAS